jgi:hypothetical protein
MDGTILHYDAAQGAGLIRAGDGKRYSFAAADWKSPEAPAAGDIVDFETDGDKAADVYRVRAGAAAAAPPPAAPPGPSGGEAKAYLAARPGMIFAILILLGCFLPLISVAVVSANLFSTVSWISLALNFMYATPAGLKFGLFLYYLLYAVPISAGWLIFQEARGQASDRLRIWVGAIGLAGPFLIAIVSSLIIRSSLGDSRYYPGFGGGPGGMGEMGTSIIPYISFGWILIIAASIALIAVGAGRSPFRKSED